MLPIIAPSSLQSDTDIRVPKLRTARAYEDSPWSGTGLPVTRIFAHETCSRLPLQNKSLVFPFRINTLKRDYLKGNVGDFTIDKYRRRQAYTQYQTNLQSDHIFLPYICLEVYLKEAKNVL